MKIEIRTICDTYREMIISMDGVVVESDALDDKEAFVIAETLFDAARELMVGIESESK